MKNYKYNKEFVIENEDNIISTTFGKLIPEKLLTSTELLAFYDTIYEMEKLDDIDVNDWNLVIEYYIHLRELEVTRDIQSTKKLMLVH